jgi:hypothetical protein
MSGIDRQQFRDTLLAEIRSAWLSLRKDHPSEHFYAFGLYTAPLAEYLMVTASTEEGLSAVTQQYLENKGGDPTLTRATLRFSPCDSPLHEGGQSLLPLSDSLRTAGPDPYDDTEEAHAAVSLVFDVAVEVLRQLDHENVFGTGLERERLVLGIWIGDQSDEEQIEFIRKLNPESVVHRFAQELEDGNRAFTELARDWNSAG